MSLSTEPARRIVPVPLPPPCRMNAVVWSASDVFPCLSRDRRGLVAFANGILRRLIGRLRG